MSAGVHARDCTRVLLKARDKGCVRRAGAYADNPQDVVASEPGFDWKLTIDRCVAKGWLAAGVAFNTYVLTPAGAAMLAEDRSAA